MKMRRHKSSDYPVHFISGYVRHRIPIFKLQPEFSQLFLESLCFYREKLGIQIFGYVIMLDHYHLLLGFPESVQVSNFLRDFKSYVGRQMVERLKVEGSQALSEHFRLSRQPKRHRDPIYGVFQPDNDDRVIYSEKFFRQKVNYIHDNPARKGLVTGAANYPWSSCRSYLTGEAGPILLDPWG